MNCEGISRVDGLTGIRVLRNSTHMNDETKIYDVLRPKLTAIWRDKLEGKSMRQIAAEANVSEATVCRAIQGKPVDWTTACRLLKWAGFEVSITKAEQAGE